MKIGLWETGGRPAGETRWDAAGGPEPAAGRRGRGAPGWRRGRTWYIPINACGAKSVPSARARGDRTGRRSHPRGRPCRPLAPVTRSTAYAYVGKWAGAGPRRAGPGGSAMAVPFF